MLIALPFKPAASLLALWLVVASAAVSFLPSGVALPSWYLYAVFFLLPCLSSHIAVGAVATRIPRAWFAAGAAGIALFLIVLVAQSRALHAFALGQDPYSVVGGLLSNAFVTGHSIVWPVVSVASVATAALAYVVARSPNYAFKRTAGTGHRVS
jgi:hypothetical protein